MSQDTAGVLCLILTPPAVGAYVWMVVGQLRGRWDK